MPIAYWTILYESQQLSEITMTKKLLLTFRTHHFSVFCLLLKWHNRPVFKAAVCGSFLISWFSSPFPISASPVHYSCKHTFSTALWFHCYKPSLRHSTFHLCSCHIQPTCQKATGQIFQNMHPIIALLKTSQQILP